MPSSPGEAPLKSLHEALVVHGLDADLRDDHVLVEGGRLRLEADLHDHEAPLGSYSISLELRAYALPLGTEPIREFFAGHGKTRAEAAGGAFMRMLLGSFHVIIESLTPHQCDEQQADIAIWQGQGGDWRVWTGPLVSHGGGDEEPLGKRYPDFLRELRTLFEETVAPGPHWLRVFLGAYDGQHQGSEVMLDNQPWQEGQRLLLARDWAWPQEYQSIRQFSIALPAGGEARADTPWRKLLQKMGVDDTA